VGSARHDLRFDYELPITALGSFVVTPQAHIGWTHITDRRVGDEYFVYFGVKLSYDF
jgi:hypothetical protein